MMLRTGPRKTYRHLKYGDPIPNGTPRRICPGPFSYVTVRWDLPDGTVVTCLEHRLVAGLPEPDLVVHHINGVPSDNRPENLQVMGKGEHSRWHNQHPLTVQEWNARFQHASERWLDEQTREAS